MYLRKRKYVTSNMSRQKILFGITKIQARHADIYKKKKFRTLIKLIKFDLD